MNFIKTSIVITALTVSCSAVHADIYKSVNKAGVIEYSDQPKEGSEKINVKNPQSITLPKASDVFQSQDLSDDSGDDNSSYQSVTITQPADGSAFNSGNGLVSISAETFPGLQPGHKMQLVMDGTPYNSNTSGSFGLSNVDRGTHKVQINVINGAGETITSSDTTTFTVHRPQVPRKAPRAN